MELTRGNRGRWIDRSTQAWVRASGRRADGFDWLDARAGDTDLIGAACFDAEGDGGVAPESGAVGLLDSIRELDGDGFNSASLHPEIRRFYERTSRYSFAAASSWNPVFRPFAGAIGALFSQRLQQLNLPLADDALDGGVDSRVFRLGGEGDGTETAWVRTYRATGETLYAGTYSVRRIPGHSAPCVRVVFPLPNGNAQVFFRPEVDGSGGLRLVSRGRRFGEPGFYFVVRAASGRLWANHVRSFSEVLHVRAGDDGLTADHDLRLWGVQAAAFHYRMHEVGDVD